MPDSSLAGPDTSGPNRKPRAAPSVKRNAAALYGVQLVSYVLPLVTFPYLAHVLGPAGIGSIGVAQTIASILMILVDFGFDYTSARKAALFRDDRDALSRQFWITIAAKSSLAVIGSLLVIALAMTVFSAPADRGATLLVIFALWGSVLTPTWLYQGLQRMATLAAVTVTVRVLLVIPLFFLVHTPEDLLVAALLQFIPQLIAGLFLTGAAFRTGTIRWHGRVALKDMLAEVADASHIFWSSALTSIYMYANALILRGMLGNVAAGYYVSADKLTTPLRQLSVPPIQAMFPKICRMAANGEHEAVWQVLWRFTLFFIASGIAMIVGFELLGSWFIYHFLGPKFERAVDILRVTIVVPAIIGIASTHVQLGIIAAGKQAVLKRIYLVGAIFHVAQAPLLVHFFGVMGAAWSVVLTEALMTVLIVRASYTINREARREADQEAERETSREAGREAGREAASVPNAPPSDGQV